MRVWIVADVLSSDGRVWELIGVFSTKALALAACTAPNHAIFSMTMDVAVFEPDQVPPDVTYPLANKI